eukprot:CAMPEP_0169092138 /NCGR_PEP_ID=MMETSP1015-20121227/16745_1 /TAXON_ID=342587 /ORGANISM="Karlodinium micrum, Strain CCMP2283" /LENGTH=42 /DNA_ID= /DNA_START= /DNA_END= /DNA_ORIENTATION=
MTAMDQGARVSLRGQQQDTSHHIDRRMPFMQCVSESMYVHSQ